MAASGRLFHRLFLQAVSPPKPYDHGRAHKLWTTEESAKLMKKLHKQRLSVCIPSGKALLVYSRWTRWLSYPSTGLTVELTAISMADNLKIPNAFSLHLRPTVSRPVYPEPLPSAFGRLGTKNRTCSIE